MTTIEVANRLVELCKAGKNVEAIDTLYAEDIVALEAGAPPGESAETHGHAAVKAKSVQWGQDNVVHGATVEGPWPNGDKFIVRFTYDVTMKRLGNQRITMDETALYSVKNGKIVREEFFYKMG